MPALSRRLLPLAAAAVTSGAALAAARPARACDPDAMDVHLTAVCDAALAPARAALQGALPHATAEERDRAERALARAGAACGSGDPEEGARLAAGLSRLAGYIEGRAGLPLSPDALPVG